MFTKRGRRKVFVGLLSVKYPSVGQPPTWYCSRCDQPAIEIGITGRSITHGRTVSRRELESNKVTLRGKGRNVGYRSLMKRMKRICQYTKSMAKCNLAVPCKDMLNCTTCFFVLHLRQVSNIWPECCQTHEGHKVQCCHPSEGNMDYQSRCHSICLHSLTRFQRDVAA